LTAVMSSLLYYSVCLLDIRLDHCLMQSSLRLPAHMIGSSEQLTVPDIINYQLQVHKDFNSCPGNLYVVHYVASRRVGKAFKTTCFALGNELLHDLSFSFSPLFKPSIKALTGTLNYTVDCYFLLHHRKLL
jgi:hypothetical protein